MLYIVHLAWLTGFALAAQTILTLNHFRHHDMKDGTVPFTYQGETFHTYYKLFGNLDNRTRTPIIVLHGGPGLSHDYVLPHADLADQSYPVVLYDQIGNARSTHLPEKPLEFWSIDLFLDEFANLLERLGISEYHIVGHSWGGMMASEFIVRRQPKGLKRLVIADSPADIALWGKAFKEVLQEFPQSVRDAIANGPGHREAYWDALLEIYRVHGCRVQPFPQPFLDTLTFKYGENGDRTVDKSHMLKEWSIVDRLHLINVPTLVVNGRLDIAQDYVIEAYAKNIPEARWVKFDESSHTPFWEEREAYMRLLGEFFGA